MQWLSAIPVFFSIYLIFCHVFYNIYIENSVNNFTRGDPLDKRKQVIKDIAITWANKQCFVNSVFFSIIGVISYQPMYSNMTIFVCTLVFCLLFFPTIIWALGHDADELESRKNAFFKVSNSTVLSALLIAINSGILIVFIYLA